MSTFEAYTWHHYLPIIGFALTGFCLIRYALKASVLQQKRIGVGIAVSILLLMTLGTACKLAAGVFTTKEDLPLYLCRVVAWILPWVIWYGSRFWYGILYFIILAGTLQGILTPDLNEGFPTLFYFRYWFLHAGLVMAMIYALIVFRIRITWKDFWWAILAVQVYALSVHLINLALGSNYSYTIHKPPGPSLLDLFGPWPWYMLGAELLMVILFLLLMLPWIRFITRKPGNPSLTT